ncbi:MAG: YncE family protein, partial [bacterium]
MAITNAGYLPDYVSIVDLERAEEIQQIRVPHCWVGIEFSPDGKQLAVSITSRNTIRFYGFVDGMVSEETSLELGKPVIEEKIYPTGLAFTPDGRGLIVANILQNTVSLIEVEQQRVRKTIATAPYPNYVRVHPDGHEAYVSTRGGNSVQVIQLPDLAVTKTIAVGSRPNHMTLSSDGKRLLVACANSGDVFIIDTDAGRVEQRLDLRPYPGARPGTTPNGVALSRDGRTLYVANADNNDVAVFDVLRNPARLLGRLPTGWYPTALALAQDDQLLLVANGKGLTSRP